MGIASFSPQFFRTTGLSVLLAPIHAVIALFVPAEAVLVTTYPAVGPASVCGATSCSRKVTNVTSSNLAQSAVAVATVQRLKIVRQFEPGVSRSCSGRLFISGRMADVCAELERMAG